MSLLSKIKAWFRKASPKPETPKPAPQEAEKAQPASILDLFQDQIPKPKQQKPVNPEKDHGPVDIIVCVHNALADVKNCLQSVIKNTNYNYRILLVNDGSDQPTTDFLRRFSKQHQHCNLLENKEPLRYTYAANQGMRHSVAPVVVMLNSDTEVPANWLKRLMETLFSSPNIGMAGPLSNAASWQSIPNIFDDSGDWAVNYIPDRFTLETYADLVYRISEKDFPKVDFLNGFCLAIKRDVITAIGYFDEVTFPQGYGEENDYCLRAREAGFELAIADHAFVYHAKSRSYQHEQRRQLSLDSSIGLIKKHGAPRVKQGLESIRHHATLVKFRMRMKKVLESGRRA